MKEFKKYYGDLRYYGIFKSKPLNKHEINNVFTCFMLSILNDNQYKENFNREYFDKVLNYYRSVINVTYITNRQICLKAYNKLNEDNKLWHTIQ